MACQVTRSFANRACLDALGRQLQPSRDTGELTAQMQRLWQDLPQGVISDLIESMPRRISACIAARGAEVREHKFRSDDQSDAKSPVFCSQANLVLMYRAIEGIKKSALHSPGFERGPLEWTRENYETRENASSTQKNDFVLKKTGDGRYTFKTNLDILPLVINNAKNALLSLIGRYEGPACFIYGEQSTFQVGSHKDHIKKHFPKAELVGVENARHEVHNDCGAEFTKILSNFILRERTSQIV
ncbi:uncharacterized protein TNCV_792131 [Trichonephila clavipes]|nr:uncharacterized protein TNCV_792131 [Trichonephila clavipes]